MAPEERCPLHGVETDLQWNLVAAESTNQKSETSDLEIQ